MPGKFFYFALTFIEAGFAVFGINGLFEQPNHTVREDLGGGLEIRDYAPTVAIEASPGTEDAVFRMLFQTIAGGNDSNMTIAMTTPVQVAPDAGGGVRMRFFLPMRLHANPPAPTDPKVRVVRLPARTSAVLRYTGDPAAAMERLRARFTGSAPYFLRYNPPFTIPFLKRNEVAMDLSAAPR